MARNDGLVFRVLLAVMTLLLSVPAHQAGAVVRTVTDSGDDLANWPDKAGMLRTVIYDCQDGDEIRCAEAAKTV